MRAQGARNTEKRNINISRSPLDFLNSGWATVWEIRIHVTGKLSSCIHLCFRTLELFHLSFAQKKGTVFFVKVYSHEIKVTIKHLLSDIQEHILKEAEAPQFVPRSQLTLAKPELGRSGEVRECNKPCSGIQEQQLQAKHNPPSPARQGQVLTVKS